jgi:hypothetical protein
MEQKHSKFVESIMGIKRPQFKNCIGIYISLTDIYVAQILEKSGGIEVESLVKLALKDVRTDLYRPAELNEAFFASAKNWLEPIKKIIESKNWATRDVVVSLSPNFSVHRHFVMEDVPRHFWKKTVPLQARKYIHYSFERAVYDFSVRPFYAELTKNKQLEVVFSLTSKIIVATLERGMKEIGLNLAAVETAPVSVFRLFNQTDKEAQKNVGKVYANFSAYEGQFLFAINNTPVLMREVEVNPSMGTRNRLEVNNCIDFISKQIEKNVFEDIVVISQPSQMDWIPLLEMETKKNVRKWNIEDIFGFKVSGFAEIAAMGACLKFVNNDVPDIDLAKKYRSSNEEIKGTISIWKVALTIIVLLFLWGIYAQITSMKTYRIFEKQKVARVDGIEEFRNLSASQIRDRVAQMKENALDLSALIVQPKYTTKLSALPDLMPDEMFFKNLQITYPIASKAGRAQNSIVVNGMIHSLEGSKVELTEGSKFNSRVGSSPAMADLCKNNISWDYPPKTRSAALGTAFSMKCSRE